MIEMVGKTFKWTRYDMWGNDTDGYDCNDTLSSGEIELHDLDQDDKQDRQFLTDILGYTVVDIEYDGNGYTIYIDEDQDRHFVPMFYLEEED